MLTDRIPRTRRIRRAPRGQVLFGALLFAAGIVLGALALGGARMAGFDPLAQHAPDAKPDPVKVEADPSALQEPSQTEVEKMIQELQELQARTESDRQKTMLEQSRVAQERSALEVMRQQIDAAQKQLDSKVAELQTASSASEQQNLKRLAKMWAGMTPAAVYGVAKELDEVTTARILFAMSDKQIAPVLEAFAAQGPAGTRLATSVTNRLRTFIPAGHSDAAPSETGSNP
ncbi:MAG: hypothetical protein HS116_12645 [Planctomycetes bacterium]|nr:hypothetical protein [Planctomycetota bacterium]